MGAKPEAPKETAAERAFADIGVDRMRLARQMRPIRADLFKRVSDFRQQSQQMRDQSSTDFAVASTPIRETAANTGDAGASAQQGLALARAGAGTAAGTEQRINKARVAGLQGLADMAVGESGEAIAGMGRLAEQSRVDAINRAREAAMRRSGNAELVASGLGAVAGLYGAGLGGGSQPQPKQSPGVTPLTNAGLSASFSDPRLLTQPSLFGGP